MTRSVPKHDKLNVTSSMTYGSETQQLHCEDTVIQKRLGLKVWGAVVLSVFDGLTSAVCLPV